MKLEITDPFGDTFTVEHDGDCLYVVSQVHVDRPAFAETEIELTRSDVKKLKRFCKEWLKA